MRDTRNKQRPELDPTGQY
ncbi:maker210 [Drosophila busckii]|uniref:Maker210 n=1 Tax=Drosophila busckii TaxID=30019 RepID=A0A0M4EJ22_DROBS|nr:maker210 [Drosophila busckii]